MPIDADGAGYRRVEGLRAELISEQMAAVIKVDPRLLPWEDELPAAEFAIAKTRLAVEAAAHPRRSTLLDKLRAGEPVVVQTTMLRGRLPANAPPWISDPRMSPCVRIYADDVVEPADGPPDQCA